MASHRALIAVVALSLMLAGCGAAQAEGDVAEGRQAFIDYGCISCHAVSGVPGADARVGPRLDGFAEQRIIAGQLPNNRENLVRWITDPQAVEPGTAMPDSGVTDEDAEAIAAFLHSLDER